MLRVLFINNCLTGGGSEKAMTNIANYFESIGISTSMILLVDKEKNYEVNKGINIIECYCPVIGNKIKWQVKRITTLRSKIKELSPDIIITFMTEVNYRVILASLGLGIKIIQSERADPNSEKKLINKIAIKTILKKADYTVFQTEQAKKFYPQKIQERSEIIPNAISNKLIATDRTNIERTIVSYGRFSEQKNYDMLIDSFYAFNKKYSDFKLVIYGDGSLRGALEEKIRNLGISDNVLMPGYTKNVTEKIKNAFMYINCSNYEGISNAMLEAMCMGIPSICTDCPVGGAAMVIDNGYNGLLIPVNDRVALTSAMLYLVENEDFRNNISKNATKVSETFSIERIGEKWVSVVKKVLDFERE